MCWYEEQKQPNIFPLPVSPQQGERSWWRNRGSKEEEATCWVSGGEMGKGEGGSGGGEEARKACGQERTLPP